MTHVFIVNDKTFKYHLEYMFAGTGAGDKEAILLENYQETNTHSTTERNLVGMIADISRIRKDDRVIFYLTGCGKFYGFFKVSEIAFYDGIGNNYLYDELGKLLTFRVLLESDVVYSEGVTEHECLDNLDGINNPFEMCWSLIYRKLKGNRGCTMIFDYEAERIETLIKAKNSNAYLIGNSFTYDNINDKIVVSTNNNDYLGNKSSIDISARMLFKANRGNAFEVHLQAYIMQNFDKDPLKSLLFSKLTGNRWIGNEVSCGVGMQRIDVMTITESQDEVYIKVIELKHIEPYDEIVSTQLKWYVKWCNDYVIPNFKGKQIVLESAVLAKKMNNPNNFQDTCSKCKYDIADATLMPTQYIGFTIQNNTISFEKIF